MREILYRGKDVTGNWHYGVPLVFTEDYVCITAPHTYNKKVEANTIGQYTGLCDKNGKKIFEGDIVKFEDDYYVVQRECDTDGGYWAETGYILKHIGWNDYMSFTSTIDAWCNEICVEIIGNIHDNPELLKGGAE